LALPAQAKYSGGSGTAKDPYQIATPADLIALGETPQDYDKHFILTADIDLDPNLPGGKVFHKAVIAPDPSTGLSNMREGKSFSGVFDGGGHTVSHLRIRGVDCVGLFGQLDGGRIQSVYLLDADVTGTGWYVGGLVGYNLASAILRCYSTGTVSGDTSVGGLVGYNSSGSVTYCYSAAAVGGRAVGGLVGENWRGALANSYSAGAVGGRDQVGGLVGFNSGTVSDCYSTSPVSGIGQTVGGLIGIAGPPWLSIVSDCFWNIQTSGQTTSAGGTGKTTAEMQTAKTFLDAGWDFVGETANGAEDIWKIAEGLGYPRLSWEKYSGGTGEPNDPYQIATAADLIALGETPEDYDKHFILTADIDLDPKLPGGRVFDRAVIASDTNDTQDWFQGTPFTGGFDGNGHSISRLTIRGGDYVGLFGQLGGARLATISNLELAEVNVVGSNHVGGLVGSVGGLVGSGGGTVTQCYSTGVVRGNGYYVGGLIGFNSNGCQMTRCASRGLIGGTGSVGGLVGCNSGTISQCYGEGGVSGDRQVGGLAGWNHSQARVSQCYSTGTVRGTDVVGGLVGRNQGDIRMGSKISKGRVFECYSAATVVADCNVGGLLGENYGDLIHSYSAGAVSGVSNVGGLVGLEGAPEWQRFPGGTTSGCFWDVQSSGQATSAGGTAKTTAEMQTAKTFLDAGWDFVGETKNGTEDIWWINEGKDYPRLWWEPRN